MKAHQITSTPLKSKPELKSKGALNKILKTKRGSTYYLATNIYWDTLRSWHNPRKIHKANGNVIYINKLRTEVIYTSIGELSEEHACCKESIRKALVYLELQGLISRSY
jgi:hypothetical protein